MSLNLVSAKDQDWFVFKAKDGECEFLVRRIPVSEARRIENRHSGKKKEINVRRGTMAYDSNASAESLREMAIWALLDARGGAEADVTTEALAQALTAAGVEARVGSHVVLDGHLTPGVKEALVDEAPALVGWTLRQSAKLHTEEEEEEEGKE